jgi:DNA-binding response OmpR family regulator
MREYPYIRVRALAVGNTGEDTTQLKDIFRHTNWDLLTVNSYREALDEVRRGEVGVVLTEEKLPDGYLWRDVLAECQKCDHPPNVIVTSRIADDLLWGEVLNLGGYDLLAKPLEKSEVFGVVSLAWRQWREQSPAMAHAAAV